MLKSINPYTLKPIQSYQDHKPGQIDAILLSSHQAYMEHRRLSFTERARFLTGAAQVLRSDKSVFAELMAKEMGKPLAQGIAEAEKCAWVCDYYAENAELFLSDQLVATDARKSYAAFEPLGVLLTVMPWNFPFWQVFRALAPALMAGNAVVLKHASNVSGCALAIEEIMRAAGLPDGLFSTLLIGSDMVNFVIEHPLVKCVTLTGSDAAGRAVAAAAGNAMKKSVLELGGSDPYLILEDADLEQTVEACVTSRLINTGQTCIAAKRFIVVDAVKEEFVERFVELMAAKKLGDPLDKDTDLGPMAREDLRDELHGMVRGSVNQGASLLLGGELPKRKGAFYPPTVLENVSKGMPVYDEETFGPVAAIIAVRDEAAAITVANDSLYGLGAAVFTQDVERGERIARRELEAGCCFVNAFVKSDPRLPFGGIKQSGYGRELSSFGIREFVNIKTVYVQ